MQSWFLESSEFMLGCMEGCHCADFTADAFALSHPQLLPCIMAERIYS